MSDPLHVDDWLDLPPVDDAERDAKKFLENFRKDPLYKYKNGIDEWLQRHRLTCFYKGKLWECSGCSRMGDVWIRPIRTKRKPAYTNRVCITELSHWNLTTRTKPKKKK